MSENNDAENSQGQSPSEEQTTEATEGTGTEAEARTTPLTDGGAVEGAEAESGEAAPTTSPLDLESLDWSVLGEEFTPSDEDTAFIQELGEMGVPHEAMQRILEAFGTNVAALRDSVNEQVQQSWEQTTGEWFGALKEQYGGEKQVREAADRLAPILDQFGGDDFREALVATGMGYHPAMFQFMEQVAEKLGEPGPVNANAPGRGSPSPFDSIYSTMAKG